MRLRMMAIVIVALLAAPSGSGSDPEEPTVSEQDRREDELEEFVPSEEISADNSISFPVDI